MHASRSARSVRTNHGFGLWRNKMVHLFLVPPAQAACQVKHGAAQLQEAGRQLICSSLTRQVIVHDILVGGVMACRRLHGLCPSRRLPRDHLAIACCTHKCGPSVEMLNPVEDRNRRSDAEGTCSSLPHQSSAAEVSSQALMSKSQRPGDNSGEKRKGKSQRQKKTQQPDIKWGRVKEDDCIKNDYMASQYLYCVSTFSMTALP